MSVLVNCTHTGVSRLQLTISWLKWQYHWIVSRNHYKAICTQRIFSYLLLIIYRMHTLQLQINALNYYISICVKVTRMLYFEMQGKSTLLQEPATIIMGRVNMVILMVSLVSRICLLLLTSWNTRSCSGLKIKWWNSSDMFVAEFCIVTTPNLVGIG
jgi:hypothetical protein